MAKAPVYKRLIELFEAEGIDSIFGIPDPGFIHMAMEAEERGWNVVSPHHEQAAGFMADAWSRMTGKPGLCFGTQGPGIANMAGAMIVAAKENSPTIFLTGNRQRIAEQRVKRGRIQYLSQPQYFEAAMKYVGVIEYPEQTDEIIREAIRQALEGTPGPVYVEIPEHIVTAELDWPPAAPPEAYRLVRQEAGPSAIAQAVALIRDAKQPIILAGQGIFTSRAQAAMAEFASLMACPVVRTTGTDAYLPGLEDATFPYGFTQAGREAVIQSDLCIAIGTEIGEPLHHGVARHWQQNNANRKWIYVERDPGTIGVNRKIDVPLVGDLRDIVPQLTEALRESPRSPTAEFERWIEVHKQEQADLRARAPSGRAKIHTARMVVEATKNLSNDVVFVRDGGSVSIFGWTYPQNKPHDMVWNQNLGHLGTGLPYAIGAQIAAGRDRRTLLLTSDSAFLFHTTELETAARKKLPLVVVVGVDHQWGLEVGACRNMFGPNARPPEAYWSQDVRFDKLAEALGCHGEFVEREEDIAPAIERAFASGRPGVVHVVIDPEANSAIAEIPNFEEFSSWYSDVGMWIY